jgi:hypothetical protein
MKAKVAGRAGVDTESLLRAVHITKLDKCTRAVFLWNHKLIVWELPQ